MKEKKSIPKKDYSFVVWKGNEFDYGRICREVLETDPEAAGFVLHVPGMPMAVVALYDDFVAQFGWEDGLTVGSDPLVRDYWGLNLEAVMNEVWNGILAFDTDNPIEDVSMNIVPSYRIAGVLEEIQLAKRWLKRREELKDDPKTLEREQECNRYWKKQPRVNRKSVVVKVKSL